MTDEAMRSAYLDAKRRGLIGGAGKTMILHSLLEEAFRNEAAEAARIDQILREEGIIKDEFRVIYSTVDIRELGIEEQYGPRGDTPEEAMELLNEKLIATWLLIPEGTEFLRTEQRTKVVIESTDWA